MAAPPARTAAIRGAAAASSRRQYVPSRSWHFTSLRRLSSSRLASAQVQNARRAPAAGLSGPPPIRARDGLPDPRRSRAFFDATGVMWVGLGGDKPPDPNKTKLGRTLRILQDRLPTLLQSPLPQEILAPNITLHLFPSTHPHLPAVSGRVAYTAALWTSPIAWNRVPIVGNVHLEILAERMTSEPVTFLPRRSDAMPEQLIVRWCDGRDKSSKNTSAPASSGGSHARTSAPPPEQSREIGGAERAVEANGQKVWRPARAVDPHKEFTGIFIFDFDREGRILTHTIEQANTSQNWDKGVGAKVVGLTDWLLGGIREGGQLAPAVRYPEKHQ